MNLSFQWMQSVWFKALGWTFVHSLWQIAVIGVILFIALRLIPGRKAHLRYTIATFALWMIVLSGLSTFIIMLPEHKSVTEYTGQILWLAQSETTSWTDRLSIWLESRMPMMLTVWIGGVFVLMLRLAFSLGWVRHLRTSSFESTEIQESLNTIVSRLRLKIKPVASESVHVQSPVTIGHLKPLILFPIGIINQLSPQEVEAILTHELAHIVRRDYLSNLIQSFIETLFYYHPVTWWISRIVRSERENRADDLAVSWCGDQISYVKALMTVEEMQVQRHAPSLAIGFASHKGAMLARIQRILHIPYKNHNQMEKTVLLSLCSLCFLAFTLTSHTQADSKNVSAPDTLDKMDWVIPSHDTIPSEGTYRIHKKTDDQEISIEVENGDIKELEIDGKEIEPADFDDYTEVIDELFGSMDATPAPMGFNFDMPPMPAMPPMPGMPSMPPLPDLAPLGEMDALEMERALGQGNMRLFNGKNGYAFSDDGETKIIIIDQNGDSSVVLAPGAGFNYRLDMDLDHLRLNADEMMRNAEIYQLQGEEWKKWAEEYSKQFSGPEWEKQMEEWKEHGKEWQKHAEEWHDNFNSDAGREQQDELQKHIEMYRIDSDDLREQIEREIGEGHPYGFSPEALEESLGQGHYKIMRHGGTIGDMMAEEGLIDQGESAEIILTPDKLKINGKKMDDETHQKYLRMYEAQQGVELSGNSRVEFRTKSRGSM